MYLSNDDNTTIHTHCELVSDVDQVKRVQFTRTFSNLIFNFVIFSFRLQLEIFRLTFQLSRLFQSLVFYCFVVLFNFDPFPVLCCNNVNVVADKKQHSSNM